MVTVSIEVVYNLPAGDDTGYTRHPLLTCFASYSCFHKSCELRYIFVRCFCPWMRGHVLQCGSQKIRVGLLACHWQPAETQGSHSQQTSASLKSGSHVHSSNAPAASRCGTGKPTNLLISEIVQVESAQFATLHLFSTPNSAPSMLYKIVLKSGLLPHQTSAMKQCSTESDF